MKLNAFVAALGLIAPSSALLRFGCARLTVQRLDPLVNPGMRPSTHLHQIIGGVRYETLHFIDICIHMRISTDVGRIPSISPWTRKLMILPSSQPVPAANSPRTSVTTGPLSCSSVQKMAPSSAYRKEPKVVWKVPKAVW